MKKICLNGKYDMIDTADGSVICKADIPGSDFGNMIKNGLIENPLNMTKPEELVKSVYSKTLRLKQSFRLTGTILQKSTFAFLLTKSTRFAPALSTQSLHLRATTSTFRLKRT